MLCEQCHEREAEVNLTTFGAHTASASHLCGTCASDRGIARADGPEGPLALLTTLMAQAEAQGDAAGIARLVAWIDQMLQERPQSALPAQLLAFYERHRPPAT